MAATNARESVLDALKTLFETIKQVNGYQNDLGLATRRIIPFEDVAINDFPALFIYDDGSETVLDYQADDSTVRNLLNLKVVGIVRDEDPTTLSTTFNKFKADWEKCMWASNVLNTYADDMRITAFENISTDPPFIMFQANVKLDYWFRKANP